MSHAIFRLFISLTSLFLFIQSHQVMGSELEAHGYISTKGDERAKILWCLDKSHPNRLYYRENDAWSITQTNKFSDTYCWTNVDTAGKAKIHAERRGNLIIIEGQQNGEQIRKEIAIDNAPWYQATSWSLRRFIVSGEKRVQFWSIRPDKLKAYKINAIRECEEILPIKNSRFRAVRVELRLKGMLAPFWRSRYWFRKKDGVFLRFEGPGGPPGAPQLVVEYHENSPKYNMIEIQVLTHKLDYCSHDAHGQTDH